MSKVAARDGFRESLQKVRPILMREPLAETLGALESAGVVEYGFVDVVKMAGHACPTVSAAYLVCQLALDELYGSEMPVRGDISVTVYGGPDESEFNRKVVELGEYLPQELQSHIFKEDNILYQIALQVLSPEDWVEVKRLCDELGYCCFTPGDRTLEKAVTTA